MDIMFAIALWLAGAVILTWNDRRLRAANPHEKLPWVWGWPAVRPRGTRTLNGLAAGMLGVAGTLVATATAHTDTQTTLGRGWWWIMVLLAVLPLLIGRMGHNHRVNHRVGREEEGSTSAPDTQHTTAGIGQDGSHAPRDVRD